MGNRVFFILTLIISTKVSKLSSTGDDVGRSRQMLIIVVFRLYVWGLITFFTVIFLDLLDHFLLELKFSSLTENDRSGGNDYYV